MNIEANAERRLVQQLEKIVGPTLAMAALGDQYKSSEAWVSDTQLRAIERVRLDISLETIGAIACSDSEDIARAWFIGMNVGEDEISPVEALTQDRFEEVKRSAQRLIDDNTYSV